VALGYLYDESVGVRAVCNFTSTARAIGTFSRSRRLRRSTMRCAFRRAPSSVNAVRVRRGWTCISSDMVLRM
jgi:hypothetical protein